MSDLGMPYGSRGKTQILVCMHWVRISDTLRTSVRGRRVSSRFRSRTECQHHKTRKRHANTDYDRGSRNQV